MSCSLLILQDLQVVRAGCRVVDEPQPSDLGKAEVEKIPLTIHIDSNTRMADMVHTSFQSVYLHAGNVSRTRTSLGCCSRFLEYRHSICQRIGKKGAGRRFFTITYSCRRPRYSHAVRSLVSTILKLDFIYRFYINTLRNHS